MIHKPQSFKNRRILLFYSYITMLSCVRLWSDINYLNAFVVVFNLCIILLFWRKQNDETKKHPLWITRITSIDDIEVSSLLTFVDFVTVQFNNKDSKKNICGGFLISLEKLRIFQNLVFLWPVSSRIRSEKTCTLAYITQ